jgi:hypothetical protein
VEAGDEVRDTASSLLKPVNEGSQKEDQANAQRNQ